jgi:sugar O-acyltransferase (sialic acid O-acetyltransferase NeuD family)
MKYVYVLGAGGHAKVVIATAEAAGWHVAGVLDDDLGRRGELVLGYMIDAPIARKVEDPDATCVLAIGSNAVRGAFASIARCKFATLVHPTACVHASARLGVGTVVFAGAVIQPDVRVGTHGIVNTAASIDHDAVLGNAVHVAPGARLAGGVYVGDEVLLGIGSVVLPSVRIGAGAIVGAGAVVVGDVPDSAVVVGVPARARRDRIG